MHNDDILTLARAGYSRVEIEQMLKPTTPAKETQPAKEKQPAKETQPAEPAPTASEKKNEYVQSADFSGLAEKIEKLSEAIYRKDGAESEIKEAATEQTLDAIMAKMVK